MNFNIFFSFQLRLNVERLKSDRGVHTLEKYCGDLKFHGKGHERYDLNNVMKRLEHWAHRLHPNFRFDDFITQVEKLGKKKEMQTHMYRYRHGMLENVTTSNENAAEEEGNVDESSHTGGFEPIDELDEIIDQQIQNYTLISTAPRTPAHDRTFDSIRSSVVATPRLRAQDSFGASTPIASKQTDNVVNVETIEAAPKLTSDQMARIAENRRLAQERLKQKRLEAAAQAVPEESHTDHNDDMEI